MKTRIPGLQFSAALVAGLALLGAVGTGHAAVVTYTSANVPLSIPDNSLAGITSSLLVPDAGTITDLDVGLTIDHSYVGDLSVWLTSPQGTSTLLIRRAGLSGNGFAGLTLDDDVLQAGMLVPDAPPLFDSFVDDSYLPTTSLSALDGRSASGTWTLRVRDTVPADVGLLDSWSLVLNGTAYDSTGGSVPIPDSPEPGFSSALTSTIAVPPGFTVDDLDVRLNLQHTWVGDLVITLESPDGTSVTLVNRQGGTGNGFDGTVFDDEAMSPGLHVARVFANEGPLGPFSGT